MAMLNNKMVDIAVVFMGVLDRLVTGHHGAPSCIFFALNSLAFFEKFEAPMSLDEFDNDLDLIS